MSSPEWGSPQPEQGQPEWLSSQTPPSGSGSGSGRGPRRGAVIGASVAAFALVAGGGAFAAYQFLDSAGDQPSDALPGNAMAYARIDLDPSAGQKIAVVQLLRRVPQFEKETGITSDREDLRRVIVDRFLGGSECAELSFDKDFEPWIGDRAGLAVMPTSDEPQPVVAVQVTDQDKAQDAVDALSACSNLASAGDGSTSLGAAEGDAQPESGIEFVGDYMLIAQSPKLASDLAADAESAPLSEDAGFSTAMDALGEQGVASFWADVDAIREQLVAQETPQMTDLSTALEEVHSYSAAFRAGGDYLEFAVQVDSETTLSGVDGNPIERLPGTTLGAFSVSNSGDLVDSYWAELGSVFGVQEAKDFERDVTQFERQTGLRLPQDLRTVLGDKVTGAVDKTGLTPDQFQSLDSFADINVGIRFTTDPEAIRNLLDRVQTKLEASGANVELASAETDDGLVVASNPEYARTLAADGDLGSSEAFQLAVPDAQEAVSAFYVDLDMIADLARDAGGETANFLEPMRSFGVSVSPTEDGFTTATMRLTFN